MLHPPDLFLLLPLFSDIVIDVQDPRQFVLLVQERDSILFQDVGAGGELDRHFAGNPRLLGEHLLDPVSFLGEDLEVPQGHRGDARPVDAGQFEVCLVGRDDLHCGIDDQHGHRVLLDDRLGSALQFGDTLDLGLDLFLSLPLPGEIVVDDEDALDRILVVKQRDAVLLEDMGARGQFDDDFRIYALLLLNRLPEARSLLRCDLEVSQAPAEHLVHRDPAHLGVGSVYHGYFKVRLDDQHGHRVLLDDGVGSLQEHFGLVQAVLEALLLFLLLLEQRVDGDGQGPEPLRNSSKVDLRGVVAVDSCMECSLDRLGQYHRPLLLSRRTRHNRPGK